MAHAELIPPHHDPDCWGCGAAPGGIRLPCPAGEGLTEYDAWFSFDERHQGGPGLVHGGLVAAALDEACGLLATWYRSTLSQAPPAQLPERPPITYKKSPCVVSP